MKHDHCQGPGADWKFFGILIKLARIYPETYWAPFGFVQTLQYQNREAIPCFPRVFRTLQLHISVVQIAVLILT